MGNTYIEFKSLNNYIRVARGQNVIEGMNMKDLVLVKKDTFHFFQDMRTVKRMG